jgi:hypothetical protein
MYSHVADVQARTNRRNERDKATEASQKRAEKRAVKKRREKRGKDTPGLHYIKENLEKTKEKPQRAKRQQYLK